MQRNVTIDTTVAYGTIRELAAALLVGTADPHRSKAPATNLMLNRN